MKLDIRLARDVRNAVVFIHEAAIRINHPLNKDDVEEIAMLLQIELDYINFNTTREEHEQNLMGIILRF